MPAPLRERRSNDRGDLGTAGGKSCYSPTSNLYYYSTPMGSLLSQLNVPLMNHCAQLPPRIPGPQFAIDGSLRLLRVNTFCLGRLISHATCTQDPSSLAGVDWRASSSLSDTQSSRLSLRSDGTVLCARSLGWRGVTRHPILTPPSPSPHSSSPFRYCTHKLTSNPTCSEDAEASPRKRESSPPAYPAVAQRAR